MELRRRDLLHWGVAGLTGLLAGCARDPDLDHATSPAPGPDVPATPTATGPPEAASPPASPSGAQPQPTPTRTVAAVSVPVLCRDSWGARPPLAGSREHDVERVMLHHSAVRLDDPTAIVERLRGHQAFHVEEHGWPDIAYHRAVGPGGHVFELRDLGVAGDTATSYDPAGSALVLVEGDFDRQDPTDQQVEVTAHVTAALLALHGLDGDLEETVTSHRDHASTSCPGDRLYARLPEIRTRVAALLADRPPELVELCGEEAEAVVEAIRAGRG